MVEPLRHRQTKGAATDMFYLTPPRHISTLPKGEILAASKYRPLLPRQQTYSDYCAMSVRCQFRKFAGFGYSCLRATKGHSGSSLRRIAQCRTQLALHLSLGGPGCL